MTGAGRWDRIEALFDGALARTPAEREDWIRKQAGNDSSLQREVLAMLRAHATRDGVLDRPLPLPSRADTTSIAADLTAALADRYILDRPIGEGGTATVFLAREPLTERSVIIKVLKPEIAIRFGARRFRTEVAVAARLSHPHILGLIDSGESGHILYYVMPHVGGETLRTRLARDRPDLNQAVALLRDLADALAYAHREGVVHRDIKPENVLCVDGRALLMDFGIARLASTLGQKTTVGAVLGTPGYMAPEQRDGREVDHRADLWAWGVVARELLLGDRAAEPIAQSLDALPPVLRDLVNACLAVDRARRPVNADYVLSRLEGLMVPR